MNLVMSYHSSVTLCGDLNCKNSLWDYRMGTPNGEIINSKGLLLWVQPTLQSFLSEVLLMKLDIAIIKNICLAVKQKILYELSLDYSPAVLKISSLEVGSPPLLRKFTSWKTFIKLF
jgi:Na+-translocating ferredoxin:NAD+ oxidoreductase RnfC subunit